MIRRGFTLIEILASLLLFAVGVLAVVGVIAFGQRSATRAQGEATAFLTAVSVLRDPLPLGRSTDPATGTLRPWTWTRSVRTWTALDGAVEAWRSTDWAIDQATDVLVPDMAKPIANNPAVFLPGADPLPGCARGWLNGYYVERREQSRASDRMGMGVRLVEVRVDVYWAGYGASERPLASAVDRIVRQAGP